MYVIQSKATPHRTHISTLSLVEYSLVINLQLIQIHLTVTVSILIEFWVSSPLNRANQHHKLPTSFAQLIN